MHARAMPRLQALLVPLFLLACDAASPDVPLEEEDGVGGKADGALDALVDGTPEAIGVLRLLASPETTLAVLDDEAGLDRRAAQNLIAHRDGPDRLYEEGAPGSDDDVFDSVAEVDAVAWVGPSTLQRLLDFALQNDFVPGGGQRLGTWDGVEFTVAQAQATLAFVNAASEDDLYAVLRDPRPVRSIEAARPLASVQQLSLLYYVGRTMLERLKHATLPDGLGNACSDDDPCPAALRCMGRAPDGIGLCVDITPLPGQDEECSAQLDCGPDLVCSGLTVFDMGWCRAEWMTGAYPIAGGMGIPPVVMAEPTALLVFVRGLASVPEDIVVEMDIEHSDPSSVRLALRDPNGQEAVLWDGATMGDGPIPNRFVVNHGISRDDAVNGEWALLVQNVEGRGNGSLMDPVLHLTSRFD